MAVLNSAQFSPTLGGRYYYEPEIYAKELERIFGQMWVCVGRAEAIPEKGQFFLVDLGGENIIVVRGRDLQVRAFYNVCRHRGARVCNEQQGKAAALQCRYHAWTYGLDGKLNGAPNIINSEAFDREAYGLVTVAAEVWEGMIWLNLSDKPSPIEEQLHEPIIKRFGSLDTWKRYGIGDLTVGKSISYDVEANWKLVVENFMECYHCGPMHPELCQLIPAFRGGVSYQAHVGVGSAFADDIEGFNFSGKATRPILPNLSPAEERMYYGLVLWPNVLVSLLPDHVILHTALPMGPERTRVVCDWIFDSEVAARLDFDPMDAVEVFDLVNRQDWEVCEMVQKNARSRAFANGGIFVPTEQHINSFNDLIRQRIGAL